MDVFCLISPGFATCSPAMHAYMISGVIKRMSTFASFALNTLAPMLFYSHNTCSKLIRFFFHVRDMPLRFNSLYLYFSELTGRMHPNLYINCYGLTIHSFPNFRPPKFFSASFQRKKSFFRVFRGQREYFKSCLYSKLKNSNVCALIDRTLFSWLACSDFFHQFFSGKFSSKRSWSFWNRFDIPCCPPPFLALTLIFYNTFAGFCFLLGSIGNILIDRNGNFPTASFWRK